MPLNNLYTLPWPFLPLISNSGWSEHFLLLLQPLTCIPQGSSLSTFPSCCVHSPALTTICWIFASKSHPFPAWLHICILYWVPGYLCSQVSHRHLRIKAIYFINFKTFLVYVLHFNISNAIYPATDSEIWDGLLLFLSFPLSATPHHMSIFYEFYLLIVFQLYPSSASPSLLH